MVEFMDPSSRETERSFTRDVSEEGMRFPTTVKLAVGQEVNFLLQLPAEQTTVQTHAQVIWVREISRRMSPQYEVGVRFRWKKDPSRDQLVRYIMAQLRPAV